MAFDINQLGMNIMFLAIAFGVIVVSWQLARFFGKATENLDELKNTNKRFNKLLDRIESDYDYVSSTIKSVSSTVSKINQEVIDPIRNFGNVFRIFNTFVDTLWMRFKSQPDDEDYLPSDKDVI